MIAIKTSCICCENATKPENHEQCASVALMLMKNDKGEPFFNLEKAKAHCGCFASDTKTHVAIVNQLREQKVEKSASFELKPLETKNGLSVKVPKEQKSILTDFDDIEEDQAEDESEVEESEDEIKA